MPRQSRRSQINGRHLFTNVFTPMSRHARGHSNISQLGENSRTSGNGTDGFSFPGMPLENFPITNMVADEYNLSSEVDEHDRDEFPR